jgi:hypothetical protein
MKKTDSHLNEKLDKIKAIEKEQRRLVKEALLLLKRPYRYQKTFNARIAKAMAYLMAAQSAEVNKLMLIAQPRPKPEFKPGGIASVHGPAIVGEMGREVILNRDGTISELVVMSSINKIFINKMNMTQQPDKKCQK